MYMLVSVAGARDGKWAWLVSHGGCGLSTRLATPSACMSQALPYLLIEGEESCVEGILLSLFHGTQGPFHSNTLQK